MTHFIRSVPTPQSLRAKSRRLDRRITSVSRVLTRMQLGATLQHFGGSTWSLSTGQFVPSSTAIAVIARADVVPNGDGLFADTSQSFRMKETTR